MPCSPAAWSTAGIQRIGPSSSDVVIAIMTSIMMKNGFVSVYVNISRTGMPICAFSVFGNCLRQHHDAVHEDRQVDHTDLVRPGGEPAAPGREREAGEPAEHEADREERVKPVQALCLLVRVQCCDQRIAGDFDHAVAGGERRGARHQQPERGGVADARDSEQHERDAEHVTGEREPGAVLQAESLEQRPHDEERDRHAPQRRASDEADLVIREDELLLQRHQDVADERERGACRNQCETDPEEQSAAMHVGSWFAGSGRGGGGGHDSLPVEWCGKYMPRTASRTSARLARLSDLGRRSDRRTA